MDLYEIIKALEISQNKYLILRLLSRPDLLEILALLDKEFLVEALNLFSKEQLMKLLTFLPKQVVIKMLLHVMRLEYFIEMMPREELFAILQHKKLTEKELIRGFEWAMDPKYLKQMLGKLTGEDVSKLSPEEVLSSFKNFKKRQILESMKNLPLKALQPLILFLVQEDQDLLMNVSNEFIMKQFLMLSKPNMIESFRILPEDILLEFLSLLPDQLLAMAANQIDDIAFERYLLSNQTQLLSQLGSGEMAA